MPGENKILKNEIFQLKFPKKKRTVAMSTHMFSDWRTYSTGRNIFLVYVVAIT